MLSAHHIRKEMMHYRNMQYIMGLAADQNPGEPGHSYWLYFFGKPAPFVTGPEKGSRPRNLPVAFCYIEKLRRGYYNMVISMGEEHPKLLPEGALTVKFVRYMENVIGICPDMWLWSHNRWKHQWKDEYKKLWVDEKNPPGE
jgi:KDO2-lipid IV(A) lauroyltransferase